MLELLNDVYIDITGGAGLGVGVGLCVEVDLGEVDLSENLTDLLADVEVGLDLATVDLVTDLVG